MKSPAERFEKIPTRIFDDPSEACSQLAGEIATLIRERSEVGKDVVLGLATGSTPVPLYRELIRLHKEEGLSFANVTTFNLDEYFGLAPDHPESYARFMADQLFAHVDLDPTRTHVPSGTVSAEDAFSFCAEYEAAIEAAGGIDIQILGIGRTGHIGFNEPGSAKDSITRRITLDRVTREDAAQDFLGLDNVPRFAITMGVGTILAARRVVLMAWGGGKADIVSEAVEGPETEAISASFLQSHAAAEFLIDRPASGTLTRSRCPWLVGPVRWKEEMTCRAVTWLSAESEKPILRLKDEDYNEHGMGDLLTESGSAYDLNIQIFNRIGHTITGWPGGKPDADDADRPEKAEPYPKRCLVFSPEPQDELVGMGGTIERLIEQGHEVHIAFLTSGGLRVPDRQVAAFAEVLREAGGLHGENFGGAVSYASQVLRELAAKGKFGDDTPSLREIKALMRREEARGALAEVVGGEAKLHFLDLPFYEKGRYRRFVLEEADVVRVSGVLGEVRPQQIYLSGHLDDPSSHRALGFRAVRKAMEDLGDSAWLEAASTWLYRIGGKRLRPDEITMAVPLSPGQLEAKVNGVNRYRSHVLPGGLEGGEDRATAQRYDSLGLAEYEAIESFQRWTA